METTDQLNQLLREKLEANGCKSGRLKAELTTQWLLSLSAERIKDGKTILIWDFPRPLLKAIDAWQTQHAPEVAVLTIDIDLPGNTFTYHQLSKADKGNQEKKAAQEKEKEIEHSLQELKRKAMADTTPFGEALAEKVATALKHNTLAFGHRDYCGTGLELHEGLYKYGQIWDGWMEQVFQSFDSRADFVQWLSHQSNATFSMTDSPEKFYWNNQVITRDRLEAFVAAK